jgi:hypothetical protein
VTGWKLTSGGPGICLTCFGFETNHPTVGSGAPESADNVGIYASTSANNHVDVGQEAVLSGRVRITGGTATAREFRFGLWDKVKNGVSDPVTGWLGYMALNASGPVAGLLQVRNPDDKDFNSSLFLSDQGGTSIAKSSGPAPTFGSPLADPPTAGGGMGRYFLLAQETADDNAPWTDSRWYNFELRVRRISPAENLVRASLIADSEKPSGDYNNNGIVDAADYTLWRNNMNGPSTALQNRNPLNSGNINAGDYTFWKQRFGATSGAGAGSLSVPEPATCWLLAVVLGFMIARRGDR